MKRAFEPNKPSFHALLIGTVASFTLFASASAWSQWLWQDAQGRKVFSDQAPPASIPDSQILKRPSGVSALPVTDKPAADIPPPKPAAAKSDKETDLDRKTKELKAKEEAEQQAQKQKQAEQIAASCERTQRALRTFQSGSRMTTTNDKGEREIMDDQARAAEIQRMETFLQANCNR